MAAGQTSSFMLDISNLVDERIESAIFRAVVTEITPDSVRIKRVGATVEDAQDYAAVDIFPFPILGDEVVVLKLGKGYTVLGRLVRSGIDVLHSTFQIGETYRFSETALQIATEGAQVVGVIGIDGPLTDTPEANPSYWKLSGSANDNILASDVTLGVYATGVEKGAIYISWGSFGQTTLRTLVGATVADAFRASAFNNDLGAYIAPIIQFTLATAPGDTTIAAGVISLDWSSYWLNAAIEHPSFITVDTEAAAATDDLDTINGTGVRNGQVIVLQAANSARTVVAKDGTGNLRLAGDMTLDNAEDTLTLIRRSTTWCEMARSNNGA